MRSILFNVRHLRKEQVFLMAPFCIQQISRCNRFMQHMYQVPAPQHDLPVSFVVLVHG